MAMLTAMRIILGAAGAVSIIMGIGFLIARTLFDAGVSTLASNGLGVVAGSIVGLSLLPAILWSLLGVVLIMLAVLLPSLTGRSPRGVLGGARPTATLSSSRRLDRL